MEDVDMTDWQTTVFGAIAAGGQLLSAGPGYWNTAGLILSSVGLALLGWHAATVKKNALKNAIQPSDPKE